MIKKRKLKVLPFLIIIMLILLSVIIIVSKNNKKGIVIDNSISSDKEEVTDVIDTKKSMSIVMVGDALIHDAVYEAYNKGGKKYDFTDMLKYIKPVVENYDLAYYNQETIIGGKDLGLSNYPLFNSPDEIGIDLVKTGFNMVSLANNHSMDKGVRGLEYSVNFWKSMDGVITAGSYASLEERNNIKVYDTNGIKYAFLSYTVGTNGIPVPDGKEYLVNVYSDEIAKNDIDSIKDKVDVIIVAMHWGSEYTHTPTDEEKRMAKYLSSLGVNLIIGSHPHVIQPVDYVDDTLVIYSLGNFISSQRSLGLNKIIGLMVGLSINVENNKVTFDNIKYDLLFTYDKGYKDFKIIPFSKLNNDILNNYEQINEEYMNIVNSEVYYD